MPFETKQCTVPLPADLQKPPPPSVIFATDQAVASRIPPLLGMMAAARVIKLRHFDFTDLLHRSAGCVATQGNPGTTGSGPLRVNPLVSGLVIEKDLQPAGLPVDMNLHLQLAFGVVFRRPAQKNDRARVFRLRDLALDWGGDGTRIKS